MVRRDLLPEFLKVKYDVGCQLSVYILQEGEECPLFFGFMSFNMTG